MYENDRDEINFHKFLKSVRKSQKATQDHVGIGICSRSEMSRVEKGSRLPDKLVRDRMTARLGISGEEYEEYLLPREYRQWEHRMEIIHAINKKDISGAEERIASYQEKYHDNNVDNQFVESMRFMVYEMKDCSKEVLLVQIRKALACTVSDMDAALGGLHLLADQELNLIMEYIRLETESPTGEDLAEWKFREYRKVVAYVENSQLDTLAQAKVYARVACLVAEVVLADIATEKKLRDALELCTRAIEVLRDSVRLYYFVELCEYRMRIIDTLGAFVKPEEKISLKEMHLISKEWAELFHELYTENELPVYMENFTYLYTETECNNAVEVIRIRRKMMGLTQEKLGSMTCSAKTLSRIETGEVEPYMATVREIFDKLGLCAEYKRARVVTSDAEAMRKSLKLAIEINTGEYLKAHETHKELSAMIDMNVVFNEQEIKRMEALIFRGLGYLSKRELYEVLVDVLECTIAVINIEKDENNYLSREELTCVHNFAAYTDGEVTEDIRSYCENLCIKLLRMEEFRTGCLAKYEMIMDQCANYIGSAGEYIMSKDIGRKLLKESLRNRRLLYLVNCEYNEVWIYQRLKELSNQVADKTYIHKSLMRGMLLSNLSRKEDWKLFFQQKLQSL